MTHKLKKFAIGLTLGFALSALTASAAVASGEQFHSTDAHTTLEALQDGTEGSATAKQTFKTTAGELTCDGLSGSTTLATATATSITLAPTYTGCKRISDGTVIHVRFRSCAYLYTSEATPTHAQVHIECSTAGDEIRTNATVLGAELGCLRFPAQTPTGGGVTYHNVGSGTTTEITVTTTATGLEYTELGFCGNNTVANDGTFSANLIVTGKNTAGLHVGISWS